jgi:anti-sigma factor RsiW
MSDYDLKGYLLGELNAAERKAVEAALAADTGLREELARLKGTVALLRSVPDEEPPRRIAFVSDKSIAPTPWWKRIWNSAPQLGFVSAALLAGAIMVNAWTRPVPQIVLQGNGVRLADLETWIASEVDARMENVIYRGNQQRAEDARVIAQEVVAAALKDVKRQEQERQRDVLAMDENLNLIRKQLNQLYSYSRDAAGGGN